jgi:hypothetical protein
MHYKGLQNKVAAPLMWVGVRVFGSGYILTPYRWGFEKRKAAKTTD